MSTRPQACLSGSGRCLCGAVRYRVYGPLRDVIACHCKQCQRASGAYFMATNAPTSQLAIDDEQGSLRWFRDPEGDWAERGFCQRCGSNLFWRRDDSGTTSITAGTLDMPSGLRVSHHIFVNYQGDYYHIGDGLPQLDEGSD